MSRTHTSVTLDVHFHVPGPNNSISRFSYRTGQWTHLLGGFRGLPNINTGRHTFTNMMSGSTYVYRTYTWNGSSWVTYDIRVTTSEYGSIRLVSSTDTTVTLDLNFNYPHVNERNSLSHFNHSTGRWTHLFGETRYGLPRLGAGRHTIRNLTPNTTYTFRGYAWCWIFFGWRSFDYVVRTQPSSNVTLTFNGNGGSPATQSLDRRIGTAMGAMPATPTRNGYVFLGWFNTSAQTGGTQFTAQSIVPGVNTTYWARWTRRIVVRYNNIVNVDTVAVRNHADSSITPEIKQLFLNNFGIDLVRDGSARFYARLNNVQIWGGTADRLAPSVLDVNRSDYHTLRFRFVNYGLRNSSGRVVFGSARQLNVMIQGNRVTGGHLGDMVVSTNTTTEVLRRTIVHEISHVFGAPECNNSACVMFDDVRGLVHNAWCDRCRNAIFQHLNNWRVAFP